jgi:hypothetical protein
MFAVMIEILMYVFSKRQAVVVIVCILKKNGDLICVEFRE